MEVISAQEAKDRKKWDHHSYEQGNPMDPKCSLCGEPRGYAKHVPYDPAQNRYPKMLHKAYKREDGKITYGAPEPHPSFFKEPADYWAAVVKVQKINDNCQRIVHSDREYEEVVRNGEGWRDTPTEAIEFLKKLEDQISMAAAHRHYEDRNMSEKAKAEANEADEATDQHLAEIPEKKRRGRPRKQVSVAS